MNASLRNNIKRIIVASLAAFGLKAAISDVAEADNWEQDVVLL